MRGMRKNKRQAFPQTERGQSLNYWKNIKAICIDWEVARLFHPTETVLVGTAHTSFNWREPFNFNQVSIIWYESANTSNIKISRKDETKERGRESEFALPYATKEDPPIHFTSLDLWTQHNGYSSFCEDERVQNTPSWMYLSL